MIFFYSFIHTFNQTFNLNFVQSFTYFTSITSFLKVGNNLNHSEFIDTNIICLLICFD